MLLRRRSRRVAAVVGLLAGLALLLAAVVDGGMTSPTRADGPDGVAAVPHSDLGASAAQAREDHPAWGHPLPPGRVAIVLIGLLALAAAVVVTPTPVAGPHHRAPALRAVRHRGPPVAV